MTRIPREPAREPAVWRATLLDQLAYLIDEMEAAKPLLARLPADLLVQPGFSGEPSILALYGQFATADAQIYAPAFAQTVTAEAPALPPIPAAPPAGTTDWDALALPDVLAAVRAQREALVDQLQALPLAAWHRTAERGSAPQTLFEQVHGLTLHDADRLREIGHRLHTFQAAAGRTH